MNTIEQPEAPGDGSAESTGRRFDARADTADVVLLLVTILTLMGIAAGIAIGFPLALEIVATHANAATTVFSAPQAREDPVQPEEEIAGEDEPIIVDDVRSAGLMYAPCKYNSKR